MQLILITLFILPILGFLVSLLFKNHQEKIISSIAICTTGLQIIGSIYLLINWIINRCEPISYHFFTLYESHDFHFNIELYYDKLTVVYSIVASVLLFIVSYFSKTYMHRESGFKRFYIHFLLFNIGLVILILSGNFETFFLGWEIVGISSFLLISFYRDRYLPVKNAMKVLSYYRLSDVALVVAFCISHHLFHTNVTFLQLNQSDFLIEYITNHGSLIFIMSLLIVFASAIKSAQIPFSSWLPRAMEGPTVSSAIFYGSMSVHLGVFLLMRTYPIWENNITIKIILIAIGIITVLVSSFIASVQPTAKTQIAYSSITQIGFMFIEVALGWHWIALLHFTCNAFLRTYQFLVSPSIMSYLIHEQFFNYDASKKSMFAYLPKKIFNSLYILSIKEFGLDYFWFQYIWMPLKKLANLFSFLRNSIAIAILLIILLVSIIDYCIYPLNGIHTLLFASKTYAILAFITILVAWTERKTAIRSWMFVCISQVFFMLSIIQKHTFSSLEIIIYMSGTSIAFLLGIWCLQKVKRIENNIDLNGFHGHIYEHPKFGLLFLLCTLAISGFPISSTFLGFDILFSEIELNNIALLILSACTFIVLELTVIRIYARIFLGQHVKTYHEVAFRSS